ncbi:MAG: hypothetical protein OEV42_17650 [Deltaproteobacteria bacterium]|nr:hypothetical protein [Deltaproteobacteria bacterium]
MYYKVLMEGGHVGSGKSYDMCRYFKASNVAAIFDLLGRMPRLKSKGFSKSVKLIERVSEEEFRQGRYQEKDNAYLATYY